MEIEYYVEGDGIFICSRCGRDDFADKLELEAHERFGLEFGSCKPKVSSIVTEPIKDLKK